MIPHAPSTPPPKDSGDPADPFWRSVGGFIFIVGLYYLNPGLALMAVGAVLIWRFK